jgi:cytoskeleton protein RodZ
MTEEAGVGAELAQARQALGLSVADVAQQLKYSTRQIEALEEDRFEKLPSGMFARGMLRAYAKLVRLDAEPLLARIAPRVTVPDSAAAVASVRRAIPITDSSSSTNLVYAALSIALLAVIAAVVVEWQHERASASRLVFVPAAAPLPAPATAPVGVEPQQVASTASPLQPRTEAVAETAAPVRKPAAGGARRLVLRFERESWVEVRGKGGKILLSQLNAAGSEREVEGEAPFQLIIGNAQHVRLSYDDRPVDLTPHVKVEVARLTLE